MPIQLTPGKFSHDLEFKLILHIEILNFYTKNLKFIFLDFSDFVKVEVKFWNLALL